MNTKSKSTLEKLENNLRFRNYAESSIETYVSYAKMFLSHFNKDLYHIPIKDARAFLIGYKYSSISQQNQIISAVKHLYRYVAKSKLGTLDITRPRKQKKIPRIIDKDFLIEKIKAITNLKHRAIIQLAFSTGMRVSEVINLKIEDIDSKRMIIHIRNAKGNKDRIVKLTESTLPVLRRYFRVFRPVEYLFNGQFKPQYSQTSCNKIVKKYLGEDFHFHLLRHSSLTAMIECGTDASVVQKVAGHENLGTTQGYVHISKRMINQVHAPI